MTKPTFWHPRMSLLIVLALLAASWHALPPSSHLDNTKLLTTVAGWTTYHHDNSRAGLDPGAPSFPSGGVPIARWSSATLDGSLYAETLALGDRVFAATENNTVYALDEATGQTIWSRHLANSVSDPATAAGCGNINPVGITGTPVIDSASQVLYAVGLVAATSTTDKYQLFAVHLSDGTPLAGFPIDITPAGLDPVYQIQRAALGLAPNGNTVYVAFGGWSGDCRPYHPFVVGIPVGTSLGAVPMVYQPQTSLQNGGGIWEPSGMSIDGSGNVYVATGNGFTSSSTPCNNSTWDHGDGVIKLSPTLAELSSFAPSNWCALNQADSDLGSVGPMLLPNGLVFATGKSGDGWLLNSSNLGSFGGKLNSGSTRIDSCPIGNAVFGGLAYAAPYVYVPCNNTGLVALTIDPVTHNYSTAWRSTGYSASAPIVAGGVVWTMPQGGGTLYGLDAVSGAARFTIGIGSTTRFATPTEDRGWVMVPETNRVIGLSFGTSATNPGWNALGGVLSSGPAASSFASNRTDVFVRGTDNGIWHSVWDGAQLSGWESLGGTPASDPGAVSWGPSRIDLFVQGTDQALWHKFWYGSWSGWETLGGTMSSAPGVSSWTAGRLDVFSRGTDNSLIHKWWNGSQWGGFESLGGVLTAEPGAVSWGPNRIDVFVRGTDNALWHRFWYGAWSGWESMGGVLTSEPAVSSCSGGLLDVFVLGSDGGVWRLSFNGSTWGGWNSLGGQWTGGSGVACRPGSGITDLFERGLDNHLWHRSF